MIKTSTVITIFWKFHSDQFCRKIGLHFIDSISMLIYLFIYLNLVIDCENIFGEKKKKKKKVWKSFGWILKLINFFAESILLVNIWLSNINNCPKFSTLMHNYFQLTNWFVVICLCQNVRKAKCKRKFIQILTRNKPDSFWHTR